MKWTLLSVVMAAGTPNLEIQPATVRVSAHAVAVVEVRGTTSTHLVLLSIIVMTCVWPPVLVVRGPTRSTCRWVKRRSGMGIGLTGTAGFL